MATRALVIGKLSRQRDRKELETGLETRSSSYQRARVSTGVATECRFGGDKGISAGIRVIFGWMRLHRCVAVPAGNTGKKRRILQFSSAGSKPGGARPVLTR